MVDSFCFFDFYYFKLDSVSDDNLILVRISPLIHVINKLQRWFEGVDPPLLLQLLFLSFNLHFGWGVKGLHGGILSRNC